MLFLLCKCMSFFTARRYTWRGLSRCTSIRPSVCPSVCYARALCPRVIKMKTLFLLIVCCIMVTGYYIKIIIQALSFPSVRHSRVRRVPRAECRYPAATAVYTLHTQHGWLAYSSRRSCCLQVRRRIMISSPYGIWGSILTVTNHDGHNP